MKAILLTLIVVLCGVINGESLFGTLTNLAGSTVNNVNNVLHGKPSSPVTMHNNDAIVNICNRDVYEDYKKAYYNFFTKLNYLVAQNYKNNYVFSPLSVWLSVLTLAEGCHPIYQKELFAILNLPEEKCLRDLYYSMALSKFGESDKDFSVSANNLYLLDENSKVDQNWARYVNNGYLNVAFAPIRNNPALTVGKMQQLLGFRSPLFLSGNSALFNAIDFQYLWRYTFPASRIERNAPFYSEEGKEIGRVDYMRMTKRVKLAHLPHLGIKVLELPIGYNDRYKMLVIMNDGLGIMKSFISNIFGDFLYEVLQNLMESVIPIDVALPYLNIHFEFDVRPILEQMGIVKLWNDPTVTSYISNPPAWPGSYHQQVSFKMGSQGLENTLDRSSNTITGGILNFASNVASGAVSVLGRSFIANKPFMYLVLDSHTDTCMFAGTYSGPTNVY